MKIPGLSFSLKRALGVTQAKQQFARKTGIPTSKAGLERKIGKAIIKGYFRQINRFVHYTVRFIHPIAGVYQSMEKYI